MKKIVITFIFMTAFGFAQNINNFKAVIIPLKFDFIQNNNQYRLCTISKVYLTNAGFKVFYANDNIPKEYSDRCELLYYNIVNEDAFFATKFHVEFNDCRGNLVYKSDSGYSKEKETELAYSDALKKAFVSVNKLNYSYNNYVATNSSVDSGTKNDTTDVVAPISVQETPIENSSSNLVYAQPTSKGYQLVDSSAKELYILFKTSNPFVFLASKGDSHGVLIQKDNVWFFEYYQNEKLVSEKVNIKF